MEPPQVSESLAEVAESTEPADGEDEEIIEEQEVVEEDEEEGGEDPEDGEEEQGDEDQEEEEEEEEQRISAVDLFKEKMRQDVQSKISLKDDQLRIYSTAQLSTEIEAVKVQERSLLTRVEQQQYVQSEMKSEIKGLQE